ncbi:hypothetical protein Gohar_022881 [Gossypium harknessii]|uniref:Uncharacterized protein n=1 Tax=Gossypium harknessii TaxID=34285 RepID=A0A7J9HB42_9ROSI|nr:hypothetical protein [Gossypium harknessii]
MVPLTGGETALTVESGEGIPHRANHRKKYEKDQAPISTLDSPVSTYNGSVLKKHRPNSHFNGFRFCWIRAEGVIDGPRDTVIALGLIRKIVPPNFPVSASEMAKEMEPLHPWFLDLVPMLVVIIIAAHVFALVYWIFRLATDTQPERRKTH